MTRSPGRMFYRFQHITFFCAKDLKRPWGQRIGKFAKDS